MLGRDFPGQRIGPEPTTDRFVAVMDGSDERVVPGNALTVSPNLPYRGLDRFGVSFLNKFEASQLPSPVLRNITIVDTPGEQAGVSGGGGGGRLLRFVVVFRLDELPSAGQRENGSGVVDFGVASWLVSFFKFVESTQRKGHVLHEAGSFQLRKVGCTLCRPKA